MTISKMTLRVPTKTLLKIKDLAAKEGMTTTDYILSKADPDYSKGGNILQVPDVVSKLDSIPQGHLFNLRSLFNEDEWISFSTGSRISTGRLFYQSYVKGLYDLDKKIKFIKKDSANLAQYKKL